MSRSAFSQSGSPRGEAAGGDTTMRITAEQAKEINLAWIELQECTETRDALSEKIARDSLFIVELDRLNASRTAEMALSDEIRRNQTQEIQLLKGMIKNGKNKGKKDIILGTSLGAALGLLVGLIAK